MLTSTDFLAAYIGIPVFLALYVFWKVFKRTSFINSEDADITTGKAIVDAEDAHWPGRVPRNFLERVWLWIA